ncbi:Ribosomal protein S3, C-terminal [Sesbania bispinosa]|nr:Ribosomal protein S3, C-terminal [Sesbania bispinosa]
MATQMSKKRKFVADGVFFAELNEVLTRELAEDGYSGVEVRVTPMRTEIIIRATRTQAVLGEKGRRIRELTSVVQKRFKFPENNVELYAEKVNNRGLCAIAQAESLRYKLLGGLAVRRACYGVLRFVMESGAKGCEVIVSGKLRAQRAKSMKFKDGYMISSGQPVKDYIDSAVRHVLLRQGVLGIKVKIMLDWDPKGKQGPKTPLPDIVTIHTPKEEEEYTQPAAAVLSTDIENILRGVRGVEALAREDVPEALGERRIEGRGRIENEIGGKDREERKKDKWSILTKIRMQSQGRMLILLSRMSLSTNSGYPRTDLIHCHLQHGCWKLGFQKDSRR